MFTTVGLTNGGVTPHYKFQYDDSLSAPGGPEPARTNAVIAASEGDFGLMSGWFKNINLGVSFPSPVSITQNGGGAGWGSSGGNLTVTINPGQAASASFIRYLLVAEVVEVFMLAQAKGWFDATDHDEGSIGEGLSRFLAAQFLAVNGFGNPPTGFTISNDWLGTSRVDHVSQPPTSDNNPDERTGCSCLFIWYLFAQLGFSADAIVAAAAPTLAGVYANLTADRAANAFLPFQATLNLALPGTSTITAGNLDNPFPINFTIDGIITDAAGQPISGSMVEASSNIAIYRTTALTPPTYHLNGNARFYNGNWTVTASAPGHDSVSVTLKLPNGAHIVQNFVLQVTVPGTITGTVTDDGGNGLGNSRVWLGTSSFKPGRFATTSDLDGKYTLADVPPGQIQVSASHGTLFLTQRSPVTVIEGETTVFDIALVQRRVH